MTDRKARKKEPKLSHWINIGFVIALLLLLAGSLWFYQLQNTKMQQEVEKNLTAIAVLKSDQISDWRTDQIEDARYLIPIISDPISEYIHDPTQENESELLITLKSIADQHDYNDILLVSPNGDELITLSGEFNIFSDYRIYLEQIFAEGKPKLLNLHKNLEHQSPHLSVITPLYEKQDRSEKPFAALVNILEASDYLYPLLESYPLPSDSAETLLVRRDGEDVLFLNELRFQPDAALNLRIPLNRTDVPAVMAILGTSGFVQGVDYREVEVAAVILPIPETPWYIVSKIDRQEAFADWIFESKLLLALFAGLIVTLVSFSMVYVQAQRKAHYQALYLTEAALRTSEQQHSITLKSIGDAVIATDAHGAITLMNQVAEKLTGWKEAEAIGKSLEEVFIIKNALTKQKALNPVSLVLETGQIVALGNHTKLIAKGGEEYQISDSGAPIKDEQGRIIGVVMVFRDVSESYQMRAELAESERRFRQATMNAPLPIMIHAEDGEVILINETWTELSGYRHDQIPTMEKFTQLAYGERKKAVQMDIDRLYAINKRVDEGEYQITTNTGEQRTWLFSSSPLGLTRTGKRLVISMAIDITKRKQAQDELTKLKDELEEQVEKRTQQLQEQVEKLDRSQKAMLYMVEDLNEVTAQLQEKSHRLELSNRELEAFSYSVSHDLRAPLRAINGYAHFLEEDYLDRLNEEGKRYLRVIQQSADHMNQLISDLLNLSRVSRTEINLTAIDMQEAVQTLFNQITSEQEKAEFEWTIEDLPTIKCDPILIKQVWQNLISNALKYSQNASVKRIEISATENEKYVVFCVKDYGAGFNPKYKDKLFGVFQRLHSEDEFEGSGIGLAIVQRIILRHGGEVWADGKIGEGAAFFFSLPKR
jgi:PAS domain S-box-containing protein